jgi:hypothetical protein
VRALLPWFPMGSTWASSTPLSKEGLAFAWSLMEVLHQAGGDETKLTCAQIGTRVRLTAKESERGLAELMTWTSVERKKNSIKWSEWRDGHLGDPKRAARNRRYRQGQQTEESSVSRDAPRDARETTSETSRRRSTASPEERREEEKKSEQSRADARTPAPAPPPARARLGRLEPSPRPTTSGPVDLQVLRCEQEGR